MEDNKEAYYGGAFKFLLLSFVFMFSGPVLLFSLSKNKENILYYPVLILGAIICFLGAYFLFRAVMTIVNTLFDKK